jgi:hypothetical protein
VSGKNNKILPIPETMQGISTSAKSKGERSKKKKKKKKMYTGKKSRRQGFNSSFHNSYRGVFDVKKYFLLIFLVASFF